MAFSEKNRLKIRFVSFLGLVSLVLCQCLSKDKSFVEQMNASDSLKNAMSSYFSKLLKDNFEGSGDYECYKHFLKDYIDNMDQVSLADSVRFLDVEDRETLLMINSQLFIRDIAHYYYFYPEVLVLDKESYKNLEQLPRYSNGSEIIYTYRVRQVKMSQFDNFYESHNLKFTGREPFIGDLRPLNTKTSTFMLEAISLFGEVSLFYLVDYIIHECPEELQNPKIREIVAVLFWKLVCLEADINFHSPLP